MKRIITLLTLLTKIVYFPVFFTFWCALIILRFCLGIVYMGLLEPKKGWDIITSLNPFKQI